MSWVDESGIDPYEQEMLAHEFDDDTDDDDELTNLNGEPS